MRKSAAWPLSQNHWLLSVINNLLDEPTTKVVDKLLDIGNEELIADNSNIQDQDKSDCDAANVNTR